MSETSTILRIIPSFTFKDPVSGEVSSKESEHNIFRIENLDHMSLFWVLMLYLAKHGKSDVVERILFRMFDGAFTSLNSYSRVGAANRITAWGAGRLNSLVLERFGLISAEQARDFASGISLVAGFTITTELAETITKVFKPLDLGDRDDGFPDQLTIADSAEKPSEVSKSITLEKKEG